jgi:protein gp37
MYFRNWTGSVFVVALKSSIEWTESTWNPTTGCDQTSPGCDHCYALTLSRRLKAMGNPKYQVDGDPSTSGPGFGISLHPEQLALPHKWRSPRTIFVNSMSDLFHPQVPDDFIVAVFEVMESTPRHTYQVLTKRAQRLSRLATTLPWPSNVWMGVSIENSKYAFRANHLRKVPASVRFISAEPLLGPLQGLNLQGIHWLIAGGESGPGARPMHPRWVRDLRDQCVRDQVAFFFKQWGAWAPDSEKGAVPVSIEGVILRDMPRVTVPGAPVQMRRVGKGVAGRRIDNRTWNQMPTPN